MTSERERRLDLLAQYAGRCIALPEVEVWQGNRFNEHFEADCVVCREARNYWPIAYTFEDVLFVDVPYGRVLMAIVADLTNPEGDFCYHVYAGRCNHCGTLHWTHGKNHKAALQRYWSWRDRNPLPNVPRVRVVQVFGDDVE